MELTIDYTNWRGERSKRQVVPREMSYTASSWHPTDQWMLSAYDLGKQAERQFAVCDIHEWIGHTTTHSHQPYASTEDEAIIVARERIIERGALPYASVDAQLEVIEQLAQFPLGRFLLQHGGLNGYWTNYVIHPNTAPANELEDFLLNQAPLVLAMRQRDAIFRQVIQQRAIPGACLASLPCGLMRDLLTLELPKDIRLVGIDLDFAALVQASQQADQVGLSTKTALRLADGWNLDIEAEFDLLSSNGLSLYEPDDQRLSDLYRQFFKALKPGGDLVTSTMTPPPMMGDSEWLMEEICMPNLMRSRLVITDVVQGRYQNFRSSQHTTTLLQQAGFENIEIIHDRARLFPTLVARKTK